MTNLFGSGVAAIARMRYPLAEANIDWLVVQDDAGAPPRIVRWADHLGPVPTEVEIEAAAIAAIPPPSAADVNAERDRRSQAGFLFGGKTYQFSDADRQRINGAGTLAALAIMGGAQPGDLRWHGGASDFVWIAADNNLTAMDAQTVVAFGQAAAAWESAHVFAARALKDLPAIPVDYTADGYWPARAI